MYEVRITPGTRPVVSSFYTRTDFNGILGTSQYIKTGNSGFKVVKIVYDSRRMHLPKDNSVGLITHS